MKHIALDKMSVRDLRDLSRSVDNAIAGKQAEEQAALRDELAARAAKAGYSIAALFGGGERRRKASTAAVRYRDPGNPDHTWSGRGRRPRWLHGKSPEQFRVPGQR